MPPPPPLVALHGLGVRIGDTPILRDLDLTVAAGEVVGVHGANGSGKTTLLRVVATLLKPTDGTGTVLGTDLLGDDRYEVRRRIELIGHAPGLYPELTLLENTEFVARITGRGDDAVAEVLDRVGLGAARARRAAQCSHGMQRRAEFARILLTEPDLVLLDEAHAGLDPQAADLVALITKQVAARGGGALLVSHDADRIADFAAHAYEVSAGRLWGPDDS